MKKILYLDCSSGISGDMFLGSLIDCGVGLDYLISQLRKLKMDGYELKVHRVKRHGIAGTKFDCINRAKDAQPKRRAFKEVMKLIGASSLPNRVKEKAASVFGCLADSEARVHAVPKSEVHFHEVAGVDSIVDIVGSCIAIEKLGVEEVYSSSPRLGSGSINAMGAVYPNPAPATAELLKEADVEFCDAPYELVTPTGAAILKALSKGFGRLPAMKILKVGYGAGAHEIPGRPNLLRAIIGQKTVGCEADTVTVIETNIDDMNPAAYEYLMERLFEAGALEVYLTPVIMKKSRPGCVVTVLAEPSREARVYDIIFEETTTLGVRQYQATRRKLERRRQEIKTRFGAVNVKVGLLGGEIRVVAPEYEDCKRVAKAKGVAFRRVYEEAVFAAGKRSA